MTIAVTVATAVAAVAATVTVAIAATAVIASGVRAVKKARPKEELSNVDRSPPPVFPSPQELPVLGSERAQDRLQGHAAALALHFRARQDRPFAHHRRLRQEAARARACDQAGAFFGSPALRDPLGQELPLRQKAAG